MDTMATARPSPMLLITTTVTFADERIASLSQMKKENMLMDFVIQVNGDQIRCHRLVLAAASPYFKVMLDMLALVLFNSKKNNRNSHPYKAYEMNKDVLSKANYCRHKHKRETQLS